MPQGLSSRGYEEKWWKKVMPVTRRDIFLNHFNSISYNVSGMNKPGDPPAKGDRREGRLGLGLIEPVRKIEAAGCKLVRWEKRRPPFLRQGKQKAAACIFMLSETCCRGKLLWRRECKIYVACLTGISVAWYPRCCVPAQDLSGKGAQ